MANHQVQDICEQILQQVKSSKLNFSISETPFSLEIKIKKRFITPYPSSKVNFLSQQKQNLSNSQRIEQKFSIAQSFPLPPPGYQCNRDQKAPPPHPHELPSEVEPQKLPLGHRQVPQQPLHHNPQLCNSLSETSSTAQKCPILAFAQESNKSSPLVETFLSSHFYQKHQEESLSTTHVLDFQDFPKLAPNQCHDDHCKQPPDSTDFSAWESFPFKQHPEVLTSESDENSDDDNEYLQKLLEKYNTEVLTSDSDEENTADDEIPDVDENTDDDENIDDDEDTNDDENTDDDEKTDDEDFEGIMMKLRMRTRLKLKDK